MIIMRGVVNHRRIVLVANRCCRLNSTTAVGTTPIISTCNNNNNNNNLRFETQAQSFQQQQVCNFSSKSNSKNNNSSSSNNNNSTSTTASAAHIASCFYSTTTASSLAAASSLSNVASIREKRLLREQQHRDENAKSLDDLCTNNHHMDLPVHEFALGCSFLHQVALGNIQECQRMLESTPSLVNFRDYDRRTPLHVAASEGHAELCAMLIAQGALINRSDRWGGSPLDDAHRHRHGVVVSLLRQHKATFGSPSQANNFITAASEGDIDEVKALLEFGSIEINQGDYDQRTALHLAAGNGQYHIVELLCQAGANVNVRDRWGNRPLDDAIRNAAKSSAAGTGEDSNASKCVQLLQEYGAKRGAPSYVSTATTAATASGQEEALLDLMHQYGKQRNGKLSMDWYDVYSLLKGIGEDPTDLCVQKLFQVADLDGDGLIDTQDFLANSDTFLAGRPARIILVVGGPGSGKGVLCERLVKETGVVHLSSGDLLREEVAKGTALGRQVQEIMKSGGLVSSAILVTLMQKRMKDHPGKRILLDGFPRSQENARDLVTLCGKPELALHLECDDTVLMERIMKRSLSGNRADDNFETALQRIRNYHKYHNLTLDFLREEHIPIVNLDCSTTPDGIWEQLRGIGRLMRSTVRLETQQQQQQQQAATSQDSSYNDEQQDDEPKVSSA